MRIQLLILACLSALLVGFIVYLVAFREPANLHSSTSGGQQATGGGEEDGGLIRLPAGPMGRGPTQPDEISAANLRALLSKLAKTDIPARRQKLIDQVWERIEEFEPFLLDILTDVNDELIVQAIGLVGEFRLEGASLDLRSLATEFTVRPEIKAAAIKARERLEPWNVEDLRDFLGAENPLVLEAALHVCAGRPDQPTELIIPLLGHDDLRIRSAAVAAIPRLKSGADLDLLCGFARQAQGAAALAAAEALGRTALSRKAERCLHELLEREDWMVVRTALASLSSKDGKLVDVRPILSVVRDQSRPVGERLYGFIAMEKTGTIPTRQIRRMLPDLHPILRLLGARCLVTAGDRSGIPVLIRLLDPVESKTMEEEEIHDRARSGARSVLTEIAGENLGRGSISWWKWNRRLQTMPPIRLQSPPPTSW